MRLAATGPTGWSGFAAANAAFSSLISSNQSASSSAGRALSVGKEPTMPDWHCALTSSLPEAMNMGEAITGTLRGRVRISGRDMLLLV